MKSFILLTFIALSHARFNQEQVPINAIRQVQGGSPGVAATIAGAAISDLLAAADPCAKLQRGDQILSELGEGSDAVAAAIGMVAAEKNFNPFSTSQPSICNDPSLPQNALLRGITPKIDPAVGGADIANALSAQTVSSPLTADGKSIADLLSENGFSNFTTSGAKSNTDSAQSGRDGAKNANMGNPKEAANATVPNAMSKASALSAASAIVTPPPVPSGSEMSPPPPPPAPAAGTALPPPPSKSPAPAPPAKATAKGTIADPGTPPAPPAKAAGNETVPDVGAIAPTATCTCTCMASNAGVAKAESTASAAASTTRGKKEKGGAASETVTAAAGTTMKKEKGTATGAAEASVDKKQKSATASAAATTASGQTAADGNGASKGASTGTNGAEDFGSCDPTMSFEAGRTGRKATEFTFQSNDVVIAANQQDALNPNIIMNRICDELTNICNANAAAKATCLSAKAQIQALGTRDQSTADAWNALVAGQSARRSRRRV